MQTDSEKMLEAGVALAKDTWDQFTASTGWSLATVDRAICHQVGSAHRRRLFETLGLDLAKDYSTFETLGNMGSASLPRDAFGRRRCRPDPRREQGRPPWNRQRPQLPHAGARMVKEGHPPAVPGWLAKLYPFTPASFRTPSGALMSYVDEGPRGDEAVVMLHGNPTWSFYYRGLVGALSSRTRCIAPDHVGMGLSEKPADYPYTLASRIADIDALVDSLQLRKIHLVVHDWGGAVGFGFATRRPERVGRIVILNYRRLPVGPDAAADLAVPDPRAGRTHRQGPERIRGARHLDGDGLPAPRLGRAPGIPVPLRQLEEQDRRPPLRPRHPP